MEQFEFYSSRGMNAGRDENVYESLRCAVYSAERLYLLSQINVIYKQPQNGELIWVAHEWEIMIPMLPEVSEFSRPKLTPSKRDSLAPAAVSKYGNKIAPHFYKQEKSILAVKTVSQ